MTGDPDVIRTLQSAIAAEARLNLQYRMDWRQLKFMGLKKVAKRVKGFGNETHKFLKLATDRTLFLGGETGYEMPGPVTTSGSLTELLKAELALEMAIIAPYEQAIQIAMKAFDDTTRNLFEHLLKWHERIVAWLEQQIALIDGFGQDTGEARYAAEKL